MRILLFLLLAFPVTAVGSTFQTDPPVVPDTLTEAHGWLNDLGLGLNLTQAGYRHWQEGGLSTLAATANVAGQFARVLGDFGQRHEVRLSYGMIRQDTLSVRKAVDLIRYGFDIQYTGFGGAWRPSFSTEIRTQFAPGYDYDPELDKYPTLEELIVPGERLKVSDFFSPAQWTQSIGVAYEPGGWFRARAGLGLKEMIVGIERLRPFYGNDPDEPIRIQAGLDAMFEAKGEPFTNVGIQSRLTFFQAFTSISEQVPDAMWETTIALRVNSWLTVNGEFVALYHPDVLDRIQLKEVLSIGLNITIL